MGTQEIKPQLGIQEPTPIFPRFGKFEQALRKYQIDVPQCDYVLSGTSENPRVYLYPTFPVQPQDIGLIQDDVLFDMSYDFRGMLDGFEQDDISIYTLISQGIDRGNYFFPRVHIDSDDPDTEEKLTLVFYPSRTYAEKVYEADVLDFEKPRTILTKRNEVVSRIEELRRDFPTDSVPISRLPEFLQAK